MLRRFSNAFLVLTVFTAVFTPSARADNATPPPDVQAQINDKTNRLNQLSQEIQQTQATLNQVQQQKSSLQTELKKLDTSIHQLDLNIQSDAITNQKLGLEINTLQTDLVSIDQDIANKQASIAELFRALQKVEDENVVSLLLSNGSLQDALDEAQSIESLRNNLSIEIVKLNQLSDDQKAKLGQVSSKKSDVTLHQENLQNRKIIVQDQKAARQSILQETKDQEAVYQSKITELKKQQDALQDEIAQIESNLRQGFNTNVLPPKQHGILSWPVQNPRVTQHFGEHSYLYRGKAHNGLDLGGPVGTPIFAAADGVVMAVDNNDVSALRKYQYGKHIVIRHTNNLATLYGHLSRQLVSVGQVVKRGDLIGYMGSTGYATGSHLHFGLYWAPSIEFKRLPPAAGLVPVGVVLNPEDYL